MISQNLLLNVVQHPDSKQDLVGVFVEVLPVLFVEVNADVVLLLGHPGDAEGQAPVAGSQGRFPALLLGLAASGDGIGKAGVVFADL